MNSEENFILKEQDKNSKKKVNKKQEEKERSLLSCASSNILTLRHRLISFLDQPFYSLQRCLRYITKDVGKSCYMDMTRKSKPIFKSKNQELSQQQTISFSEMNHFKA